MTTSSLPITQLTMKFATNSVFFMLLPFEDDEDDETVALILLLQHRNASQAIERCPTLHNLPESIQRVALYSHFCLRVILWSNDDFTSKNVRSRLESIITRQALADLLRKDPQNVTPAEQAYLAPGRYCMRIGDGNSPENIGNLERKDGDMISAQLALEHWIVERVIHDHCDPGVLTEKDTWNDFMEEASRRGLIYSRFQIIQHLKFALTDYFIDRNRSCLKHDQVLPLMGVLYSAHGTPGFLSSGN